MAEVQSALVSLQGHLGVGIVESGLIDAASGHDLVSVIGGRPVPRAALLKALTTPTSDAALLAGAASIAGDRAVLSYPHPSEIVKAEVVTFATPVRVAGKVVAVAFIDADISALVAPALKSAQGSTVQLVDLTTSSVLGQSGSGAGQTPLLAVQTLRGTTTSGTTTQGVTRAAYQQVGSADDSAYGTDRALVSWNTWAIVTGQPSTPQGLSHALGGLPLLLLIAGGLAACVGAWGKLHAIRIRRDNRLATEQERTDLAANMMLVSAALERAAAGDLGVRLDVDLGDAAMTGLASAFDRTLISLRSLATDANEHGSALTRSAAELRAMAIQQAGAANEQSAAVVQTTSTIDELAATAASIADTAGHVARLARDTLDSTQAGGRAVRDSAESMARMQDRVDFIAVTSAELGERIVEIGGILGLIDDLSDQTNLLALNAAIEAARAGEHGRGFAVVAAEVRKLAEQAQDATTRIQGIITDIQARTSSTITASEAGRREAETGAGHAASVLAALDVIMAKVDQTSHAANEISLATGQQQSASRQVAAAMSEVAASSRQFAAGSQQTAAAAQDIADRADDIHEAVARFRVEEDGPDRASHELPEEPVLSAPAYLS